MFSKIICMGDSITKGKVWKENERRPYITEKSYPSMLKSLLNIDVINGGVCDITSEQLLQHMNNEPIFEKDSLVIVEVGGNDCNPNWKKVRKNPDGQHDGTIPLECFKINLLKIIDIIKGCGAVPVLSTLPPLDDDRYYNLLKRLFGDAIKPWIDRNGGIFKWQEMYSNLIKDIAGKTETYLIDVRESFMKTMDYRKFISFDGIHPNEDGYSLIAITCSRSLKVILDRR